MASEGLTLYITEHCTFCDDALELLIGTSQIGGVVLRTIDIASSDKLTESMGERIPVVEYGDQQLDWPFSASEVIALLSRSHT